MEERRCPNCGRSFVQHIIEALYGRSLVIDVCMSCQSLWFDDGENLQLSPRGTIDLFRHISDAQPEGRQLLKDRLECPTCGIRLSLTVDQQRSTKFQYYRCPRDHGRFITFFHFLRARNFVRTLSSREVADLRAKVRQVHCSNCGGPLDLDRDIACPYCRAPISMLDPDQVRITLEMLHEEDSRKRRGDPTLPLTLLMERLQTERVFQEIENESRSHVDWNATLAQGSGLVESGIRRLIHLVTGADR